MENRLHPNCATMMRSTMTIEPSLTRRVEVTPEGRTMGEMEDGLSAPRLQTYCDAATSFREKYTPATTGRERRRLNFWSCRNIWKAMFCWLVPRHEAEVAGATSMGKYGCQRVRKKERRNVTRSPRTMRATERDKDCGWRLWWYASSFKPPRSPACASHSIRQEVNNHSLCALTREQRYATKYRAETTRLNWIDLDAVSNDQCDALCDRQYVSSGSIVLLDSAPVEEEKEAASAGQKPTAAATVNVKLDTLTPQRRRTREMEPVWM